MEERKSRYLTLAAGLLMGLAIGFVVRYPTTEVQESAQELSQGAEKYTEIMELVDTYFIGEDVDETQVNDAMAAGLVAGLGDRWSYYVSAENYQSYQDSINNAYVGVGITISAYSDEDGNLLGYEVTDVTQGGPAEAAGVQAGDILTTVDGTGVADITLTETKNMVKGEAGTSVTLTFLRDGTEIDFTVVRQSFTVIPASGKLIGDHTGYIQIDNFDSGCADAVIGLIEDLTEQGATSLLFDVRSNPGGLKTELTKLLDYLLPEGTIFHSINYAGQEEIVTSDEGCVSLPMAVLVNSSSYSAAEYFACAIQEYGVGKVVGEQTCGKGYYQLGLQLSDGSCVNLSIGKYYTPSGESLIDVGVTPDIELTLDEDLAQELSRGTLEPENDPQVQAALATLS
jgi:carboxyl-terminal processing protease